jgi:hypothetical protein
MLSSGMLRRVTLVGTDISEELSTSLIRVTRFVLLDCMILTNVLSVAAERIAFDDFTARTGNKLSKI